MKVKRLCVWKQKSMTLFLATVLLMGCASDGHSAEIDFNLPDEQVSAGLPDKPGMTLKGLVTCDEKGVEGVAVSDGFNVTVTDGEGAYYLASTKKSGYVFISLPGGYEVDAMRGNEPAFFQYCKKEADEPEQLNFTLKKVDNRHHKLMVMTDFHLADRNDDLKQYADFVQDVNGTIATESLTGTKVYGITLGDLTWDLYWYKNRFALPEYMDEVGKIKCPVFNVIGNHDNDPYIAGDWDSEAAFREHVGPTYYSFNLGEVHYVVLDDVKYVNNGAYAGFVGERNYEGVVVPEQLEWLKKDLALVKDKETPVVVAMHINLFKAPEMQNGALQPARWGLSNGEELSNVLKDFQNVHVLTGHTHVCFTVEKGNLMEHNSGAVCATWWWTGRDGYAGNYTCKDGTPGGYAVWNMDGRALQWYYKGTGKSRDYQFRSYDLNETHITAERYAPQVSDQLLAPYAGAYAQKRSDNKVLINVWGYDEQWKIKVSENGKELPVTRVSGNDPLHIISYEAIRLNKTGQPTSSFLTAPTGHLFEVTASSPTSALEIEVTDRFGYVYKENMIRPKKLACNMN